MPANGWKTVGRYLLSAGVMYAGVAHFRNPEPFVRIVPDYLPAPRALVAWSGFFEILGGVGLLIPRVRRPAAWGLVALFVAVFPANVNMAVKNIPFNGAHHPLLLWLRLPLQAALIAWAWSFTRPEDESPDKEEK